MTDPNSPYESGSNVTVLDNSFTAPEGEVFSGWNTEADGSGETLIPGTMFDITQDITLYAQWVEPYFNFTDGNTVTLSKGDTYQIQYETNVIPTVTISLNTSEETTVSQGGLVHIGQDEEDYQLFVFFDVPLLGLIPFQITLDDVPYIEVEVDTYDVQPGGTVNFTATTSDDVVDLTYSLNPSYGPYSQDTTIVKDSEDFKKAVLTIGQDETVSTILVNVTSTEPYLSTGVNIEVTSSDE